MARPEVMAHLQEQLGFLDASCRGYDDGAESEAKRLAVAVRTICHQTARSTSLLHHLGADDSFDMLDTVPLHYYQPPLGGYVFGCGLSTVRISRASAMYLARLQTEPEQEVALEFGLWWDVLPVIFPVHPPRPTRKTIVTWLANKVGGAHVDEVPAALAHLLDGRAMGYGFQIDVEGVVFRSPLPFAMRQIAEEVRLTLRRTFPDELN